MDFQAYVGNYRYWAQNIKNQLFKVSRFLVSFELSTIFLSCRKVSKVKRNFKYALWYFCEDKCMETFPNFKQVFLSFSFPSLVLSFGSYLSQILIYSKNFICFMQGIGWAFKKYGNDNLCKLVIEPENCGPTHICMSSLNICINFCIPFLRFQLKFLGHFYFWILNKV